MVKKSSTSNGQGANLIGYKLRYKMGDANVVDNYVFTLTAGDDLKVHYEGAGRSRDLIFTKEALDSAVSHMILSQGNAKSSDSLPRSLPDRIVKDLPPFLLSRAVFAALKSKGKATFKSEWREDVTEITVIEKKKVPITIESKKVMVPILHCMAEEDDCELSILDDDTWPIILKHEEEDLDSYDGFFWEFLEAGKDLVPSEEADEI